MRFTTNTSALAAGLKTAGRAISSKATLPVLENVLIEAIEDDGGYLAVSGTNLEIGLRTRVPATVDEEGAVTLPAKLLTNLMSTWKQEADTTAELDEKTQTLALDCDGASAEIKGIAANEYPIIADPSEWENVALDAFNLRQALDRVVFSAASDETRPILTGVYIHAEGETLVLAAADGFRMSIVEMDSEWADYVDALGRGLIVPSQALQELTRLIPGAGKPVRVCFRPGQLAQVAFVVYDRDDKAETILVSQLIDGNFPDYRQIVPKETALTVRADTYALTNAVQGAMVFATHSANIVEWWVKDGKLYAIGRSAEMGEQEAIIAVDTDGKMADMDGGWCGKIALNGAYVLEALRVVKDARVEIKLLTPSSPLVLTPGEDDSWLHIVMPMHLG